MVKKRIPGTVTRRHVTKRAVSGKGKSRPPRLIKTAQWLEAMDAELEERDWGDADLARALAKHLDRKVNRNAVLRMRRQHTHYLIGPTCEVLGLQKPENIDLRDEEVIQIMRSLRRSHPEVHDRMVAKAKKLLDQEDQT